MQFRPSRCVRLLRLASLTRELRPAAAHVNCLVQTTTSQAARLLTFARTTTTMQTDHTNFVTSPTTGADSGESDKDRGVFGNIPNVTLTKPGTGPPPPTMETKSVNGSLVAVNQDTLRAPSPRGGEGDDDSEAESYRDGRSEEVDRETRGRAFAWCRDFLSGSWKTIPEEDFQISIVSGGLSNLLYMCSLPENISPMEEEPRNVLLRVYGAILQGVDSLVLESVMFAILAEQGLGPKLYGIFPDGRLEQYLPNNRMRTEQLSDQSISAEIATKLARFHGMVMPFNKEPMWLFGTIDKYMDQVMKLKFVREAHVKKFKKLMKYDLPAELDSLR